MNLPAFPGNRLRYRGATHDRPCSGPGSESQADDIVVAVDDSRVAEAVQAAGWDVQMTRSDHQSGSDRVMEVVQQRVWACDDIVINVQGDEPLVPSEVIDQLIQGMVERPEIPMATLSEPLHQANDFFNPNVVKVVTDDDGLALMFSRAPLPFPRDNPEAVPVAAARHVGIYGFRAGVARVCWVRGITLGKHRAPGTTEVVASR